jgi:hypothetical protein
MSAGWSAPNAHHGALTGFNDVWHRRQGGAGGPGPLGPGAGGGGGYSPGLLPHGDPYRPYDRQPHPHHAQPMQYPQQAHGGYGQAHGEPDGRWPPGGAKGGRAAGTGFEGLSLQEVLASRPKKEPAKRGGG